MKKLLYASALLLLTITGCKKEDEPIKTSVTYLVSVNVDDGLGYSLKFDGGLDNFVNVVPPAKNASSVTNVLAKYGESKKVVAELGFAGRGKMIEIIVTNSETGELMFSGKQIDNIAATWISKK